MRVRELVANADRRVIGVIAENEDGSKVHVKARRAVIVATGGFHVNKDLMTALNPSLANVERLGCPSNLGDGIGLIQSQGGIMMRSSITPDVLPFFSTDMIYVGWPQDGIVVGENGRRFMAEDNPYMTTAGSDLVIQQLAKQQTPFYHLVQSNLDGLTESIQSGYSAADSVEELATLIGVDATALAETIDTYNRYCEEGRDGEFGKGESSLLPLSAPFYVATCRILAFHSIAGMKQDKDMHAVRWANSESLGQTAPIPGLYAVGEVCEWNARGGWTMCGHFTTGRIAGQNAAAETPWE